MEYKQRYIIGTYNSLYILNIEHKLKNIFFTLCMTTGDVFLKTNQKSSTSDLFDVRVQLIGI